MKKILLLFAFLSLNCFAFSQTTLEDEIKTKAEEWFKQTYVEIYFDDPYSYRLMGIKIFPVTLKEGLQIRLSDALSRIRNCTIAHSERNQEGLEAYKAFYEENLAYARKEQEFIDRGENADHHAKRKNVFMQYAKKGLDRMKEIELYLIDVEIKETLEKGISELSEQDANFLWYYDVRLDCYSKNSIGNEVLGRYSFPFTAQGPLHGDQNTEYVIHLNKPLDY